MIITKVNFIYTLN